MNSDHPFSPSAQIKHKLREILSNLGFVADGNGGVCIPSMDRGEVQRLHRRLKGELSDEDRDKLQREWKTLNWIFASGGELEVEKISPILIPVSSKSMEERIFRLGGRCWGMRLSAGYGRRMRYLVWDDYHGKLMGLIGLSDPVFNLKVRDEWIGWDAARRKERLSAVMDAFVLGAVPPYSKFLGGKLVASLLLSSEIGRDFQEKYTDCRGLISGVVKPTKLALITTLSAFGRSSIYNRMKMGDTPILQSLGFTQGWGHFHIDNATFQILSNYLKKLDPEYFKSYKFGNGPNWRLRVIKRALKFCGLKEGVMKHGVKREVFACARYGNAIGYLKGGGGGVRNPTHAKASVLAEFAMERWLLPRASRDSSFREWREKDTSDLVFSMSQPAAVVSESRIG